MEERYTTRFTWDAVEPELIRTLLDGFYRAHGDPAAQGPLRQAPPGRLRVLAASVLGSPLTMRHIDAVIDILRRDWLPRLDASRLAELVDDVQLALTGPAHDARPRNKPERVRFLQQRHKTHNLKVRVRNAFVAAHKQKLPVQTSTTAVPRDTRPWTLTGEGRADRQVPDPHQELAWTNLDRMFRSRRTQERCGLLVLPTGSGKTYTMVRWLLNQMEDDDHLAVLWIADRQELVEQAALSFAKVARSMPLGFERPLRRIHSAASGPTSLADQDLDVVVATRQSLRGQFNDAAKKRIRRFVGDRPAVVVVVVDEAHHAVAPTYRDLLDFLQQVADPVLVGLTATPWPSGFEAGKRLRNRFPQVVATAAVGDLIRSGVLARPVHHTVDTGERIDLTRDELAALGGADLPASVLRRLDADHRNEIIIDTWLARSSQWGKTLVFAVDIEHADRLHERFLARGAEALVVHSRSSTSRHDVIEDFRALRGPCVLVSVGMLTEGVDLPDARTAFLARPTASRVLMRQMIGRVLRGGLSGGDDIAHVVDVRDQWADDVEIVAPVEIPDGGPVQQGAPIPGQPQHWLPPIVDELSGEPIPEDVLHRVQRAYRERITGQTGLPTMTSAALIGFYQLDDLNVPVFDHLKERFNELIDAELTGRNLGMRSPLDLFDDLPVPRPVHGDVSAVVDFVRSQQIAPPFEPLRAVVNVRSIAQDLSEKAMTSAAQTSWLRDRFESTLARAMFPSFQAFYEAIHQELFYLDAPPGHGGFDAENPRVPLRPPPPTRALQHVADRDLPTLLDSVKAKARSLFTADDPVYLDLLETPLQVDWTRKPIKYAWAYWTPRISGKTRGTPRIRVNQTLKAPPSEIPDDVLKFLLWHELLHHLLPGQGHDAEFRRLEAYWPNSERHDQFLDTLHEDYQLGRGKR